MVTWETTTIGELLEFKNGLNKSKEFFGQGTPIVNYMDVYKNRGLHAEQLRGRVTLSAEEIKRFDVRKGDVFFTRTSETPDEVGFASVMLDEVDDCVFSGFILRGRPITDKLDINYCQYVFMTEDIRKAIMSGCTYTTRALTNGKQLSAIEIQLPEKSEQRYIAETLSDADTVLSLLEQLIAKKKSVKQGAMQELLTGKRRLPGFSGEWVKKKIREIGDTSSGGTPSRSIPTYFNGNIPWVTTSELNDNYIRSTAEKITVDALNNSSAKLFPKGTVLMAMYGATIGKLGILDVDATTNQACCALFFNKDIDSKFMYFLLHYLRAEIIELGSGAGQPNISQTIIRNLTFTIPQTLTEQTAIASILSDIDMEIDALTVKLEKARSIKQGMLSELLMGRIRLIKGDVDNGQN
ncbi:restriction endonuclease subunit S [Paenibacillus sp. Leaf72]|uniref:restriction endonuclease subunit S n=1 Tax=Paenibacillus sp. Leaf72 TaxID=1736234 RepID=UPI0006F48056|nr:restriction endonuclease subunit S [Paenibacillus sp. Leaf72]KQO18073.1 hypothetical protein ASF12_05375 [Paenibacillus sp. Leaf72]